MKKAIIAGMIGLVVIGGVSESTGGDITEEAKAEIKTEEVEALVKANEEAEAQAKEEEVEQEVEDNSGAETIYLQILRENLGAFVDVQFDESNKIYTMTPTDQGLIDEISMLPMGVGHEAWGSLVDGMVAMSESGIDLVGEGYSVTLVNPLNHENTLLWIIDGVVIYNVIDDL